MRDVMDILKALADESRVRLLFALRGGELCVCQLIALLELAPSTVSKHLTILRAARLVENRKEGRWMYYRLSRECAMPAAPKMLDLLFGEIGKSPPMIADHQKLKRICAEEMSDVCRKIACKVCGKKRHDAP